MFYDNQTGYSSSGWTEATAKTGPAWLSSDNVQVAPQEAEISSYLVGQIDNDVDVKEFDDFEL